VKAGASSRTTPSPTVTQAAEEAEEEVEEVEEVQPVAVAAPAPVSAGIAASAPVVWGAGGSLADRLKRAEAEKAKAEAEAKAPKEVVAAAPVAAAAPADAAAGDAKGRSRGPRRARGGSASGKRGEESAVGDLAEAVSESLTVAAEETPAPKVEEVVPPPPPLVQVSAAPVEAAPALAPAAEQEFIKMGKWGANEAAEIGSFQFGSFGNAYDDSANNGVSASQVGTNPAAAPWTGLHTSDDKAVSTNVWGAPAEPSLDMSAGLFAQQSAASSSNAADLTSSNAAASRAPPGLAPKNNKPVGQNKPKTDAPQQQAQNQAPAQNNAAYNQGYNQPPGMNRNVGGLNALPAYGYNPSFDLSQQAQFGGYPLAGAVAPQVPAAGAAAATTPAATSAQGAAAGTAAAPNAALAQAQQPYAAAAPFQFFNPYYPGQYYYGQPQMANFYNQGRDMYQQRGPYGGNPYGNAGSLYPGDVYSQQVAGQFPDASGNYGMGLVHPGMQGAGNSAANTGNAAAGNNNAKSAKGNNAGGNNAVGAAPAQGMTPDQHTANLLMNSGYGYVNPYGGRGGMDAQGWQGYPGAQAGGWGAPMMPFPANPSPTNVNGANAGFAPQQAGAPQQQGQAQQGQQQGNRAGGNNAYGNSNSFGGRGSGAAPSAGGVPSQGNW
jgi:hypothetical protein